MVRRRSAGYAVVSTDDGTCGLCAGCTVGLRGAVRVSRGTDQMLPERGRSESDSGGHVTRQIARLGRRLRVPRV